MYSNHIFAILATLSPIYPLFLLEPYGIFVVFNFCPTLQCLSHKQYLQSWISILKTLCLQYNFLNCHIWNCLILSLITFASWIFLACVFFFIRNSIVFLSSSPYCRYSLDLDLTLSSEVSFLFYLILMCICFLFIIIKHLFHMYKHI